MLEAYSGVSATLGGNSGAALVGGVGGWPIGGKRTGDR